MKELKNFNDIENTLSKKENLLLYASDPYCIVCNDMKARVKNLAEELNLPLFEINISENPLARGQMNLYTAPVLMYYKNGKEIYRQGRFLDLEGLKHKIKMFNG